MRIDRTENRTSFGMNFALHREVVSQVVEGIPKLKKYSHILSDFVQKPDFDEIGFKSNNHFYYLPEKWKPRSSFLDVLGRNNAYSRFNVHIQQMSEHLSNGRFQDGMQELGRACHFLQDVNGALHVQRGTVFDKACDLKMHRDYENMGYEHMSMLLKAEDKADFNLSSADSYDDIFIKSVKNTRKHSVPTEYNKDGWLDISELEVGNAKEATRALLEKVALKLI